VRRVTAGALAGAVGTLALNAATYADITLRGRAPSTVPEETVARLAGAVGVDLARGQGEQAAEHRRTGIGALLGYAMGVTVGGLYGLVRPAVPRLPLPVAGLATGAAAMIGANAGAVSAGTTDPRTWGVTGWLADVVPHLCFGLATAWAFETLQCREGR
jgi:hypothetical protein